MIVMPSFFPRRTLVVVTSASRALGFLSRAPGGWLRQLVLVVAERPSRRVVVVEVAPRSLPGRHAVGFVGRFCRRREGSTSTVCFCCCRCHSSALSAVATMASFCTYPPCGRVQPSTSATDITVGACHRRGSCVCPLSHPVELPSLLPAMQGPQEAIT